MGKARFLEIFCQLSLLLVLKMRCCSDYVRSEPRGAGNVNWHQDTPGSLCMSSAFSLGSCPWKDTQRFACGLPPVMSQRMLLKCCQEWLGQMLYHVSIFSMSSWFYGNRKRNWDFCPRFTSRILSCDGAAKRIRISTKYRKVWPSAPTRSLSAWSEAGQDRGCRPGARAGSRTYVRKTWIQGKEPRGTTTAKRLSRGMIRKKHAFAHSALI